MDELSGRTLAMAVQAVDAEMRSIDAEFEATEGPEQAGLQELLIAYSIAAGELKQAYLDVPPAGFQPARERVTRV